MTCLGLLCGRRSISSSLYRGKLCFASNKRHGNGCWHLRSRDNVTISVNCCNLERCFIADDEIYCSEMLVGGAARVQVRDHCSHTVVSGLSTAMYMLVKCQRTVQHHAQNFQFVGRSYSAASDDDRLWQLRHTQSLSLLGKTCATTQKTQKSCFFWILKKKRKKTYI